LKSTEIALSGVLAALALAVPLLFRGSLQFVIPAVGYSATLASHVPVMLAAVAGPMVAALVGTASTLGFLMTLGPVVAARAATHILFGVAAAFAMKRGMSFTKALLLVALPLHAITEGLIVLPFGIPLYGALINIAGASIHHAIDSVIAIVVLRAARPIMRSINIPAAARV